MLRGHKDLKVYQSAYKLAMDVSVFQGLSPKRRFIR
jgi:hypothetical protein